MSFPTPPDSIGVLHTRVHAPARDQDAPWLPRLIKAAMVGLMFSVVPILVTNFVLTREDPKIDLRAFAAAIPVMLTAGWLLRPRERWYAVGKDGFALGEKFFGEVRWEAVPYDDVESVEVELSRVSDGESYRFTGYRYIFLRSTRRRVVLEGEVTESEPRGTQIHLPPDAELPENHDLRAARGARAAWSRATGRKATITQR